MYQALFPEIGRIYRELHAKIFIKMATYLVITPSGPPLVEGRENTRISISSPVRRVPRNQNEENL